MKETLDGYIRKRCKELGMSLSAFAQETGLSRQTLHALGNLEKRIPSLQTLVTVAETLRVHPVHLVNLTLSEIPWQKLGNRQWGRRDQSVFVRDVTFPDGELVMPGQRFIKTWELHNVGDVTWRDRFLQCMDHELVVQTRHGETLNFAQSLRPTHTRIPVPTTPSGERVQVSMEFTAPDLPATVVSYWKSTFADGTLCFPESAGIWVKVEVISVKSSAHAMR